MPAELSPQAVAQLYHSCACLQPASCNLGADCVLVCAVRFCTLLLEWPLSALVCPLCARIDIGGRKAGARFATRQAYLHLF